MSSIPQRFYIYTLAYPPEMGGAIFYVGKGQGYRINQHEREARLAVGSNPHKERVIRKILDAGEKVVKEKVAFFDDESDAFLYEQVLIAIIGRENLTNLTDGGEGTSGKLGNSHSGTKLDRETLQPVGKWLYDALSLADLSQAELARRAGHKSSSIVSFVMNGKRTVGRETLVLWCRILRTPSELEERILNSAGFATDVQIARYNTLQEAEAFHQRVLQGEFE